MINEMSKKEFNKLLEKKGADLISIYLPTHVKGQEVLKGKDAILLKDKLKEIENQLIEKGYSEKEAASKLAKASELTREKDFWRNQSHSLALFIDNGNTHVYRLPVEINSPESYIGTTFYVKPLIKLTSNNKPFYILFVSKTKLSLYKASDYHIEEIDISEKVPDMEEAFKYDAPERSLQYHSGNAGGSPIYHGHGLPNEEETKDLKRYFNKADKALMEFLDNEKDIPMVLSGVDYLIPLYKEKSGYPMITDESINTDPKSKELSEIHDKAKNIVHSKEDSTQSKSMDRYQHLAGTDKVSTDLSKIARASYFKRIEALYLDENFASTWGRFNQEKDELQIHESREEGDEELVNRIIINTIEGGGNVFMSKQIDLPGDNNIAALLRY